MFWGEIATSSKKACFSSDLTLSTELAYIDCIFPCQYIHCMFFFFCQTQIFCSMSFCDISIYIGTKFRREPVLIVYLGFNSLLNSILNKYTFDLERSVSNLGLCQDREVIQIGHVA